jgi:hypothetical protein
MNVAINIVVTINYAYLNNQENSYLHFRDSQIF